MCMYGVFLLCQGPRSLALCVGADVHIDMPVYVSTPYSRQPNLSHLGYTLFAWLLLTCFDLQEGGVALERQRILSLHIFVT